MADDHLQVLIKEASKLKPTAAQRGAQRCSFAYGNTAFENPRVTRAMVDEEADKLAKQEADDRG